MCAFAFMKKTTSPFKKDFFDKESSSLFVQIKSLTMCRNFFKINDLVIF